MTWSSKVATASVVVDHEYTSSPTNNSFATIPDASSTDFLEGAPGNNANGASISASKSSNGGGISNLTDGIVNDQTNYPNDDAPADRYFVDGNGSTPGTSQYTITINLGSQLSIEQFNTYSAHRAERVGQYYTLVGSNDPNFLPTDTTTIATVGLGSSQSQLGVSIHDSSQTGILPNGAPLGDFQYLQMQIDDASGGTDGEGTFYSEIDVIVAPEPASLGLMSMGALGLLARRRRHHV